MASTLGFRNFAIFGVYSLCSGKLSWPYLLLLLESLSCRESSSRLLIYISSACTNLVPPLTCIALTFKHFVCVGTQNSPSYPQVWLLLIRWWTISFSCLVCLPAAITGSSSLPVCATIWILTEFACFIKTVDHREKYR